MREDHASRRCARLAQSVGLGYQRRLIIRAVALSPPASAFNLDQPEAECPVVVRGLIYPG